MLKDSELYFPLDNILEVTKRLIEDGIDDEDSIRREFLMRCYLPYKGSNMEKELNRLIRDINIAEIGFQIAEDQLDKWCDRMRTKMNIALTQLMEEVE